MKKILIFIFFLVLGLGFYSSESQALTISPAKFILSGDPGEIIETNIRVRNDLSQTLTFESSFQRFEVKAGGEPVFLSETTGLASWIETNPSKIILEEKETVSASVIIRIPEDAEPGGHYAAIFWNAISSKKEGTGVGIVTRVGALVLLEVSGEIIESGEIVTFEATRKLFTHLPVIFSYDLKNSGTVHLKPEGKVTIKNIFGKTLATLENNPAKSYILPGETRGIFTANWEPEGGMPKIKGEGFFSDLKREKAGFVLGYYRAILNLEYGGEEIKTAQASSSFWVLPWRLLVLAIFILGILLLVVIKGINKYNQWVITKAREGLRGNIGKGRRRKR